MIVGSQMPFETKAIDSIIQVAKTSILLHHFLELNDLTVLLDLGHVPPTRRAAVCDAHRELQDSLNEAIYTWEMNNPNSAMSLF